MKRLHHHTAKPSHYDEESKTYDQFNEQNSRTINQLITKILKKYEKHSVLDMTCGTGSQVFWLLKQGFDVTGSDISLKMLKIARDKAKKNKLKVDFHKGDIRDFYVGEFDAVISIFNAVGHLAKRDFEKAMQNVRRNLKLGGLYIFDIFNLDFMLHNDQITKLTIDNQVSKGSVKDRVIQYSTINAGGILASYTTTVNQIGNRKAKVSESAQTLQIYSREQLIDMLQRNGFKVLSQCGNDGSKYSKHKTENILTVAQKHYR